MSDMSSCSGDLIVVGAGSGGIATAFRAARHGARVTLLEPRALGGTCVNVGCVPKKAMWYAAQVADEQRRALDYGFDSQPGPLNWTKFVGLRQQYIERIHASYQSRLDKAGIELVRARGRLVGPHEVEADGRRYRAPHIVLATGARSRQLDVPGFELGIDSDGFFDLQACPSRVAIVGAGYIGVELAGVLQALGAQVDLFARSVVLRGFEEALVEPLVEIMRGHGVGVHAGCTVRAAQRSPEGIMLDCGGGLQGPYERLIWAAGRVPNSEDIGLDAAGVTCDTKGYVEVDEAQNTAAQGIYALGDLTTAPALTPVAIAAGRKLADRLFAGQDDARMDYDNIPSVVFSHPPLACVGLSETQARARHGDTVQCYTARFKPMQLSLSGHPYEAVMKLVCEGAEQRVVGVHVLGPGADEMLQGFAVAVKMGARKADFDATVAIHPTSAEELVLM